MHWGLPWVGAVLAKSVIGGFRTFSTIVGGHYLHQLVLYMHAMMMQHLAFRQQQLLK